MQLTGNGIGNEDRSFSFFKYERAGGDDVSGPERDPHNKPDDSKYGLKTTGEGRTGPATGGRKKLKPGGKAGAP